MCSNLKLLNVKVGLFIIKKNLMTLNEWNLKLLNVEVKNSFQRKKSENLEKNFHLLINKNYLKRKQKEKKSILFVTLIVTGSGAGVLCKGPSCEVGWHRIYSISTAPK